MFIFERRFQSSNGYFNSPIRLPDSITSGPCKWLMRRMMTTNSPLPPSTWRVLTTVEVAEILQISTTTVRRLNEQEKLKAVEGLRTLRFTRAAVLDFLNGKKP
jgi:excisionase family DNA binding protein